MEMISMDTLIVKIMNFAQKLVNADRASLFLVDSKTNQLYARIFDIQTSSMNTDEFGEVISSGEDLEEEEEDDEDTNDEENAPFDTDDDEERERKVEAKRKKKIAREKEKKAEKENQDFAREIRYMHGLKCFDIFD